MGNTTHSKLNKSEYSALSTLFKGLASQSVGKTMDKTTFLRYFDFPGMFGERLFELFDRKKNHCIDFEEFLQGLEHYLTGSLDDKIRSLFKMYDLTGDNAVSKEELRTMLLSVVSFPLVYETFEQTVKSNLDSLKIRAKDNGVELLSLDELFGEPVPSDKIILDTPKSNALENSQLQEMVDRLVEQAFDMCDLDKSGKLDYEQFKAWIESAPNVMLVLEKHFAKHLWVGRDLVDNDEDNNLTSREESMIGAVHRPAATVTCDNCSWAPRFCPNCGNGLSGNEVLTCRALDCGTVLNLGDGSLNFCMQCGKRWQPKEILTKSNSTKGVVTAKLAEERSLRKAGLLVKLRKRVKTFKEQYYVLRNNFLYVFDSKSPETIKKTHEQPAKVVFLPGLFIEMPEEDIYIDKKLYGINMISHEGTTTIYTHSQSERRTWLRALRQGSYSIPFHDHYELGPCIGRGRFADVFEATSRVDNELYAVKIVEKATIDDTDKEEMRAEIAILRLVNHPFIVNFKAVYENTHSIFIVLSLHKGGDLLDLIQQYNKPFPEKCVRSLVWKVLDALRYCHNRGIVHRDIKPENILLDDKNDTDFSRVYLTDFGLSKFAAPEEKMTMPRGTLAYLAPEVLLCQGYTNSVDVWGVGIIAYLMLSGKLPFFSETRSKLIDLIIDNEPDFNNEVWENVSEDAQAFIRALLNKNPRNRFTVEEALKHPWLKNAGLFRDSSYDSVLGVEHKSEWGSPLATSTPTKLRNNEPLSNIKPVDDHIKKVAELALKDRYEIYEILEYATLEEFGTVYFVRIKTKRNDGRDLKYLHIRFHKNLDGHYLIQRVVTKSENDTLTFIE